MNKVILMGRLTRDPDVRYTQDNLAVARFTLAVDRRTKRDGQQNADFIGCIAFGKTAEFADKYLMKGTKMALEGRWQTGSYKNKEGETVYTNDCVVEHMEFAESKKSNGTQGEYMTNGEFTPVPEGFAEVSDDDLPF